MQTIAKGGARLLSYIVGMGISAILIKGWPLYYDEGINPVEQLAHRALPWLWLVLLPLGFCLLVERLWLVTKFTIGGLIAMTVTIGAAEYIERAHHHSAGEWFSGDRFILLFCALFALICFAIPSFWVLRKQIKQRLIR